MFYPIGDTQVQGGHYPKISYSLIAINIMVFFYEISIPTSDGLNYFFNQWGAIPIDILNGTNSITLISNQFLHSGWWHIIGNMTFLWVFADNIEAKIGSTKFIIFYLLGGIIASMTHILINPLSDITLIGASGAIAAVLGAYLIMFTTSKIKILAFFVFSFTIPAFLFLGIWIIQNLTYGIGSLSEIQGDNVAWWAHIGGFSFGIIAGLYFKTFVEKGYNLVDI